MSKPEKLEILLEYKQLFCPNGRRPAEEAIYGLPDPTSLSRFLCGTMKLEEGVNDILSQAHILEELAKNLPQKDKFYVGLKNCETMLSYICMVNNGQEAVANVKEVLTYLFALCPKYQPEINVFPPEKYLREVESWLNSVGKTIGAIQLPKAGFLNKLLNPILSGAHYGYVTNLKKRMKLI